MNLYLVSDDDNDDDYYYYYGTTIITTIDNLLLTVHYVPNAMLNILYLFPNVFLIIIL